MNETLHIENVVLGGVRRASISPGTWRSRVGPVVVIERALIGGSFRTSPASQQERDPRCQIADLVSRAGARGIGARP